MPLESSSFVSVCAEFSITVHFRRILSPLCNNSWNSTYFKRPFFPESASLRQSLLSEIAFHSSRPIFSECCIIYWLKFLVDFVLHVFVAVVEEWKNRNFEWTENIFRILSISSSRWKLSAVTTHSRMSFATGHWTVFLEASLCSSYSWMLMMVLIVQFYRWFAATCSSFFCYFVILA